MTKNLSKLTNARDRISESAATLPTKPLILHPKINSISSKQTLYNYRPCLYDSTITLEFTITSLPSGPNTGAPLKP